MNVKKIFRKKHINIAKYAIVALVFIIWVGFFDNHNFKEQFKYQMKINDLEEEKEYYLKKIREDSTRLSELNTNDENLEKYAREKYYMKKKGEEIFLVKEKNED
ncbi:septum formation initiator [Balneicella halophila]|uniref:Septum formation initiator n=1 Tax=Balneicella halophila TaxID=1537566 RepID=A0A7L4URI7_BALHA|nr:septum formation initiator family protein [Balneicella halophila]PVX52385.1 septum formation initiator [Balneicella halophila]